jgi:SOS-response transcriptional repressor LexA
MTHVLTITPTPEMLDPANASPAQLVILALVATSADQRGYPPSVREIAAAIHRMSTNAPSEGLQRLERRGLVSLGRHNAKRSITVTAAGRAVLEVQADRVRAALRSAFGSDVVRWNRHGTPGVFAAIGNNWTSVSGEQGQPGTSVSGEQADANDEARRAANGLPQTAKSGNPEHPSA